MKVRTFRCMKCRKTYSCTVKPDHRKAFGQRCSSCSKEGTSGCYKSERGAKPLYGMCFSCVHKLTSDSS